MRIIPKIVLILFTLFISQNSLTAFSNFNPVVLDTIPEVAQVYKGNRIMVKGIKISKRKGKSVKITYNLKNTGRYKVKLGKKRVVPSDLIIEFDSSLVKNDLALAKEKLIENLKKQDISIRPGQLIMGEKLKFENIAIPPSDRIAKVENKTTDPESNIEVTDEISQITNVEIDNEVETSSEAIVEPPTEIIPSDENDMEELDESISKKIDETILVKTEPSKKFNERSYDVPNKEIPNESVEEIVSVEVSVKEVEELVTVEAPVEEVEKIVTVEAPVEELEEIVTVETPVEEVEEIITEETSSNEPKEKQCPDLAVVNVEIVKKNKRNVTIKYTVSNLGNIPISLLGDTKKEEDNISIQVYFTRSEKLTRGAIPIKSFYIKKGLKKKGLLEPNASYSGKIKVETSKMTKFTPVVALSIDSNPDTTECTRDNNISFVNITDHAAPKSDNPTPPLDSSKEDIIGANEVRN